MTEMNGRTLISKLLYVALHQRKEERQAQLNAQRVNRMAPRGFPGPVSAKCVCLCLILASFMCVNKYTTTVNCVCVCVCVHACVRACVCVCDVTIMAGGRPQGS